MCASRSRVQARDQTQISPEPPTVHRACSIVCWQQDMHVPPVWYKHTHKRRDCTQEPRAGKHVQTQQGRHGPVITWSTRSKERKGIRVQQPNQKALPFLPFARFPIRSSKASAPFVKRWQRAGRLKVQRQTHRHTLEWTSNGRRERGRGQRNIDDHTAISEAARAAVTACVWRPIDGFDYVSMEQQEKEKGQGQHLRNRIVGRSCWTNEGIKRKGSEDGMMMHQDVGRSNKLMQTNDHE